MADPILTVEDLTIRYATGRGMLAAVRGVTFTVERGEIFGLVGESGSGKSSVCTALMKLLPKSAQIDAKVLQFGEHDLNEFSEKRMRELRGVEMALVPQQPMTSLSPTASVGKQLEWYLGDISENEELRQILVNIGLQAVLDRTADLPNRFSGGQLQRLLIAIATLANRPSLLLADEPTTTLDATVQAQVLHLLLELRERLGLSMLYVSHDLAVIAQVCDRVGVMYGGRLVEVASVNELFDNPRHPYTRALIAAMPSASHSSERLTAIKGSAAGANRLPGCPFAPRCPLATDICREVMPEQEVFGQSMVRCHHSDQTVSGAVA